MKIIVIGGTGLIGSTTVAVLRQGGHEVVAASPKSRIAPSHDRSTFNCGSSASWLAPC